MLVVLKKRVWQVVLLLAVDKACQSVKKLSQGKEN